MDAIDNSAGVDCSDHEVNIKILLDAIVEAGDMTEKQRNELLASMTDEVGDLVSARQLPADPGDKPGPRARAPHGRRAHPLHPLPGARGQARPRASSSCPSDEELGERRSDNKGLTAPELAILLSYSKITTLPGPPGLGRAPRTLISRDELERYFPTPLRERSRKQIHEHRLHRADHGHPRHEQPGEPRRPLLRLQAG